MVCQSKFKLKYRSTCYSDPLALILCRGAELLVYSFFLNIKHARLEKINTNNYKCYKNNSNKNNIHEKISLY